MLKKWLFSVLSILFFCSLSVRAQTPSAFEQLFSPSVGQKFYELAYELANSEDISEQQAEQAFVFLTATMNLDPRARYINPTLIKLAARYPERDHSNIIYYSLTNYLDVSDNFEPARKAIQYLLDRLDSREQRELLLKDLLKSLGGKNPSLDSELATLLGLLIAEKADTETAKSYFLQAFNSDRYNELAFEKLVELMPEQITPPLYLEHLRLKLGKNPINLEAALAFAQYAEQTQLYQTAADAYEYCVELFGYLYPSQQLPPNIYIPWMLSYYNTERNRHKCLQIASELRQSGRFDLLAEAIAGKAAEKIGNTEKANQIFQAAEEKINNQSSIINHRSIAWFYCFAYPDANKALDWANKVYSTEPNSATAASLLAYSFVMNNQSEWAKSLIENYEHNQIADLTLAQIQLEQGQRDLAIKTLKEAININPASLEAERAREILSRNGGEYIPPIDTDIVLAALVNSFGQRLVPEFTEPEKTISAKLNVGGTDFSYGSKFGATAAITNISSEPLVVSDEGLFTGSIRVDAEVTGDFNKEFPNLLSTRIRPASPIEPDSSIFIPLHLFTAELRNLLLTHPQASVEIKFTLYLDPVIDDQGKLTNRIRNLPPAAITVTRPGIELTSRFLQNRLNSLTKGRQGQQINAAQLLVGLLMEQNAMANREPLYKFVYADWMPALLKSAIVHNLSGDDWVAKAHTMTDMASLPLDYEMINALSENLNDTHWPIRLMAVYLLAKNQNSKFTKVLDWTASYDLNMLVRGMAVALGGTPPQPQPELPADQSTEETPQQLTEPDR